MWPAFAGCPPELPPRNPALLGDAEFIGIGERHLEEERKIQETLRRPRRETGISTTWCPR